MKPKIEIIIVGKFSKDGNGIPCISLNKELESSINMDKDYKITIEGPMFGKVGKVLKKGKSDRFILAFSPSRNSISN